MRITAAWPLASMLLLPAMRSGTARTAPTILDSDGRRRVAGRTARCDRSSAEDLRAACPSPPASRGERRSRFAPHVSLAHRPRETRVFVPIEHVVRAAGHQAAVGKRVMRAALLDAIDLERLLV